MPCSPLAAVCTSQPSNSSKVCSDSRIPTSSSMINTEPVGDDGISIRFRRVITAASDIDSLPAHRKIDIERSARARTTLHADLSGMFLDDAICNRQTKSGAPGLLAFARRSLGGKERIVNPLNMFLSNSGARVGNYNTDALAIGGCNSKSSTAGHGISSIQEQIQKYLLQPPSVATDKRQMPSQFVLHLDLGGLELMFQQRQCVGNHLIHIHFAKFGAAGARKIEQVVDDFRSAEGLTRNLLQQSALLRISL